MGHTWSFGKFSNSNQTLGELSKCYGNLCSYLYCIIYAYICNNLCQNPNQVPQSAPGSTPNTDYGTFILLCHTAAAAKCSITAPTHLCCEESGSVCRNSARLNSVKCVISAHRLPDCGGVNCVISAHPLPHRGVCKVCDKHAPLCPTMGCVKCVKCTFLPCRFSAVHVHFISNLSLPYSTNDINLSAIYRQF